MDSKDGGESARSAPVTPALPRVVGLIGVRLTSHRVEHLALFPIKLMGTAQAMEKPTGTWRSLIGLADGDTAQMWPVPQVTRAALDSPV